MCKLSPSPSSPPSFMESAIKTPPLCSSPESDSILLLELAASNDLPTFKQAVERNASSVDVAAPWYSRSIGPSSSPTRCMAYAHRTPAMIAALYGSTDVLSFILSVHSVDVNRRCDSDGSTALHCAAAGGSTASLDAVRLLISASADIDAVDACGNRPGDVIAKQFSASMAKDLEVLLKACCCPRVSSPTKKEYPLDLTLPDIKNGIYGTDEFRMYTFKVKPCSRAYSHDWTECPFVHPGENARRRDPRKYSYSCVPCPDFRKGSCLKNDACEYAHGVFECWLHPAQYRTRLCKDETGCSRRVCFFAHKVEELRMVNPTTASVTGHVLSSPRSAGIGVSSLELMAAALMMPPSSSPGTATGWMSSTSASMVQPPALQTPSSRLKASLSARDLDFDLEGYQQKLFDEISTTAAASPRASWKANSLNAASDYNDLFGSIDPSMLGHLQSLSLKSAAGYGNSMPSSPTVTATSSFGLDHSMAKAILNSRQAAFAKRSHSFKDRGAVSRHLPALSAPLTSAATSSPIAISDWGSPDGKLDWGVQGDELSKLRKSATFNFHGTGSSNNLEGMVLPAKAKALAPIGRIGFEQKQYQRNGGGAVDFLSWDQLYSEQERMQEVA